MKTITQISAELMNSELVLLLFYEVYGEKARCHVRDTILRSQAYCYERWYSHGKVDVCMGNLLVTITIYGGYHETRVLEKTIRDRLLDIGLEHIEVSSYSREYFYSLIEEKEKYHE